VIKVNSWSKDETMARELTLVAIFLKEGSGLLTKASIKLIEKLRIWFHVKGYIS